MDKLKITNSRLISSENLRKKLHPVYSKNLKLDRKVEIFEIQNPEVLLSSSKRFDLFAKFLFVKYEQYNSNWAEKLYYNHIKSITKGEFKEYDGTKNNFIDYLNNFKSLITSIKCHGFQDQISIIPITRKGKIVQGAHRTAIAAALNLPITCFYADSTINYDYNFFRRNLLPEKDADRIALEYIYQNSSSIIAILNSKASSYESETNKMLGANFDVFYSKSIKLNFDGSINLTKIQYKDEPWIGTKNDGYKGAKKYAINSSKINKQYTIYVFSCNSTEEIKNVKNKIRTLIGMGNYSIHTTDNHKESIRLGEVLLNDNSIHLLNFKKTFSPTKSEYLINKYNHTINKSPESRFKYCLSGSSTMALYGLRDVSDLDYLHLEENQILNSDSIHSHNNYISSLISKPVQELILDPSNYLNWDKNKYLSLAIIKHLKQISNNKKDQIDLRLIKTIKAKNNNYKINQIIEKILFIKLRSSWKINKLMNRITNKIKRILRGH